VVAQGNVEVWLGRVEAAMRDAVRDVIRRSLDDGAQRQRKQWVLQWPGQARPPSLSVQVLTPCQAILTVSQIEWTRGATEAMSTAGLRGLRQFEAALSRQLDVVVKLVRGLSP
jgi:hypothetical protein